MALFLRAALPFALCVVAEAAALNRLSPSHTNQGGLFGVSESPLESPKIFNSKTFHSHVPKPRTFETCASDTKLPKLPSAQSLLATHSVSKVRSDADIYCDSTSTDGACEIDAATQIPIFGYATDKVHQSACPIGDRKCAGCAEVQGEECTRCVGGFSKTGEFCSACSSINTFVDIEGGTCELYNLQPELCTEPRGSTPYRQLSAQDACCACGGGNHIPIPFLYQHEMMHKIATSGEEFSSHPVPRTAHKYTVNSGCNLAKMGLKFDGDTGRISGTPTFEEPSVLSCVVSAHQFKFSKGFEETLVFNRTMTLGFTNLAYIASDDGTEDPSKTTTALLLFDGPPKIRTYTPILSGPYTEFTMSCTPTMDGLVKIDPSGGVISLEAADAAAYNEQIKAHLGGVTVASKDNLVDKDAFALDEALSAECLITATEGGTATAKPIQTVVFVKAFPPLKETEPGYHPTNAFRVVVGQPLLAPLSLRHAPTEPLQRLAAVRVGCTVSDTKEEVTAIHNQITGDLTIGPFVVVNINPRTGEVTGSPHIGLRSLMKPVNQRESLTLECSAYAFFFSGVLLPSVNVHKAGTLTIHVDSDVCWVPTNQYTTLDAWAKKQSTIAPLGEAADETACQDLCQQSKQCAGFDFAGGTCYELVVVPVVTGDYENVEEPSEGAKYKIPNCQLHQTCLQVTIPDVKFLSGEYCPVFPTTVHPFPLYSKPGHTDKDTFYLEAVDAEELATATGEKCGTDDKWVIRHTSPNKDDSVDANTGTVELHGPVLTCIKDLGATEDTDNHRKVYFDNQPQAMDIPVTVGEITSTLNVHPRGRGCFSPLGGDDAEQDKSSEEDDGGNAEDSADHVATYGEITGAGGINDPDFKDWVFRFDDPSTALKDDYKLHPCQCFGEGWGNTPPVSETAYSTASSFPTFNKIKAFTSKLWTGPYVCDPNNFIAQFVKCEDCEMRCIANPDCNFFVISPDSKCMLFTACEKMTRLMYLAQEPIAYSAYALKRANEDEEYCHVADPEKCWATTGRRAYLSNEQASTRVIKCEWHALGAQCDLNKLLGDMQLTECTPCTYMKVTPHQALEMSKVPMPFMFPHGARLRAGCLHDRYTLLSTTENGVVESPTITCVDGEWRDRAGHVGLSDLQCAACVETYEGKENAFDLAASNGLELMLLSHRQLAVFEAVGGETRWLGFDDKYVEPTEAEKKAYVFSENANCVGKAHMTSFEECDLAGIYLKVLGPRTEISDPYEIHGCFVNYGNLMWNPVGVRISEREDPHAEFKSICKTGAGVDTLPEQPFPFTLPYCDTLSYGQQLKKGEALQSLDGHYVATLQGSELVVLENCLSGWNITRSIPSLYEFHNYLHDGEVQKLFFRPHDLSLVGTDETGSTTFFEAYTLADWYLPGNDPEKDEFLKKLKLVLTNEGQLIVSYDSGSGEMTHWETSSGNYAPPWWGSGCPGPTGEMNTYSSLGKPQSCGGGGEGGFVDTGSSRHNVHPEHHVSAHKDQGLLHNGKAGARSLLASLGRRSSARARSKALVEEGSKALAKAKAGTRARDKWYFLSIDSMIVLKDTIYCMDAVRAAKYPEPDTSENPPEDTSENPPRDTYMAIYTCNPFDSDQKYFFTNNMIYFSLIPSRCLGQKGSNGNGGFILDLVACDENDEHQRFTVSTSGQITSLDGQFCFDVGAGEKQDRDPLSMILCTPGAEEQQFTFSNLQAIQELDRSKVKATEPPRGANRRDPRVFMSPKTEIPGFKLTVTAKHVRLHPTNGEPGSCFSMCEGADSTGRFDRIDQVFGYEKTCEAPSTGCVPEVAPFALMHRLTGQENNLVYAKKTALEGVEGYRRDWECASSGFLAGFTEVNTLCRSPTGVLPVSGYNQTFVNNPNHADGEAFSLDFTVECPAGQALRRMEIAEKTEMGSSSLDDSKYFCAPLMGLLSECKDIKAPKVKTGFPVVSCMPGSLITKIAFEGEAGLNKAGKMTITCCLYPHFAGIQMIDLPPHEVSPTDGTYCPTKSDDLGHPMFKHSKESGVGPSTDTPAESAPASTDSMPSPPTPAESSSASTDSMSSPPSPAESEQTPASMLQVGTSTDTMLEFEKFKGTWCRGDACHTGTEVLHPLDTSWKQQPFAVVPIIDLVGLGIEGSSAMKDMPPEPPKKPAKVEFKAQQPEYNVGCEEITKEKPDMAKATEEFSDQNPCGIIARAGWKDGIDGASKQKAMGPGLNYAQLSKCSDNDINRDWNNAQYVSHLDKADASIGIIAGVAEGLCTSLPDVGVNVGWMAEVSTTWKVADICAAIVGGVSAAAQGGIQIAHILNEYDMQDMGYNDCNPVQNGINRILCDIHCVTSAVKAGTSAVLTGLEDVTDNVYENMDNLMDYYSQVVLYKMELMAPPKAGSLIETSLTAGEQLQQLQASIRRHLSVNPTGLDEDAARMKTEAHKQSGTMLAELHSSVKAIADPAAAFAAMKEGLEAIDRHLDTSDRLVAHHLALRAISASDDQGQLRVDAQDVKTRVNDFMPGYTSFLNAKSAIHSKVSERSQAMKARASLLQTAAEVRDQASVSKEGILNYKLDALTDEMRAGFQRLDRRDLAVSINALADHWKNIKRGVDKYVDSAEWMIGASKAALVEVSSYLECQADNSVIGHHTMSVNKAASQTADVLRGVWLEALSTLDAHERQMSSLDLLRRTLNSAAADVELSHEHDGAHYLSKEGVTEVVTKLAEKMDGMPLQLARQIWDMHHQVRFLQERMRTDGGPPPSSRDSEDVDASADRMTQYFEQRLAPLGQTSGLLELVHHVVDHFMVLKAPAPAMCKMLAFDDHQDLTTESLIMLHNSTSTAGGAGAQYIVSQPLSSLLTYQKPFAFTVSNDMANEAVPDDFPLALLEGVYVCEKKKSGWSLAAARHLPKAHGVSFCGGSLCKGGEAVAVHIPTGKLGLGDTTLFQSWSALKNRGL